MSWKYQVTANNAWKYLVSAFNAWKYEVTEPTLYEPAETASSTLFWLSGISGNEMVDRSGNGRNFAITGKDFTTNYFPYKSAATISAPVGDAVLIAADINNFLYDSGGDPNEIPVASLFQNIDYEDKLFCRHVARVVDGNSVETAEPYVTDIVLYPAVLTGADLTTATAFYGVPEEVTENVKWVDGSVGASGDGTKESPYKTLNELRNISFDTVYIKTSEYTETQSTFNWLPNRSGTYQGLGLVKVKGTNNGAGVLYAYDMNGVFNNIVFDAEDARVYAAFTDRGGYTYTFNNCAFLNPATSCLVINGLTTALVVTDCVLDCEGVLYGIHVGGIGTIEGCHLYGDDGTNAIFTNLATTIRYNWISCDNIATAVSVNGDADISIFNSSFTGASRWYIYTVLDSSDNDLSVEYNTITPGAGIASLAAIDNMIRTRTGWNVSINNNTISITDISTWDATPESTGLIYCYEPGDIEITNNSITQLNKARWDLISLAADDDFPTTTTVSNNYLKSNSTAGIILSVGGEGSTGTDQFNDAVISNNRVIGVYADYPAEGSVSVHGILYNKSIDIDCKYNYISSVWGGIIPKAAGGGSYTANGCTYNLIEDVNVGIWCRGIDGINVYGNTIQSSRFNTEAIKADTFSIIAQNVTFKNNIIDFGSWASYCVYFDDAAAANGCVVEDSIFYDIDTDNFLNTVSVDYNLADAIAGGFASDISTEDPELTDLIPDVGSPAIEGGATLGVDDDGLDASTDWGDEDTVPAVVTKQQTGSWDVGAYVS